jgi:hypothetical protein
MVVCGEDGLRLDRLKREDRQAGIEDRNDEKRED